MKISLIASILGAAIMVVAQTPDLTKLPSCAYPCATADSATAGTCSTSDYSCLCKNDKFLTTVATCLREKCTDPEDIQKAVTFAQSLCGSNLPSGAVSSLQGAPTGNATTSTGGNSTKTSGPGSGSAKGSGGSASSTSSPNSAAGLVPGGFAVAAIFAGLLTL